MKDGGGLINFLPLKRRGGGSLLEEDLVEDLSYKGNGYKLSGQCLLGLFGWQALLVIG